MEENISVSQESSDDLKLEALEQFLSNRNGIAEQEKCSENLVMENVDGIDSMDYQKRTECLTIAKSISEEEDTSSNVETDESPCDNMLIALASPTVLCTGNTITQPIKVQSWEEKAPKIDSLSGINLENIKCLKGEEEMMLAKRIDLSAIKNISETDSTSKNVDSEGIIHKDFENDIITLKSNEETCNEVEKNPHSEQMLVIKDCLIIEPCKETKCLSGDDNIKEILSSLSPTSNELDPPTCPSNSDLCETTSEIEKEIIAPSSPSNVANSKDMETQNFLSLANADSKASTSIIEPLDVREIGVEDTNVLVEPNDVIPGVENKILLSDEIKHQDVAIVESMDVEDNINDTSFESKPSHEETSAPFSDDADQFTIVSATERIGVKNENTTKTVNDEASHENSIRLYDNTECEYSIDIQEIDIRNEENKKNTEDDNSGTSINKGSNELSEIDNEENSSLSNQPDANQDEILGESTSDLIGLKFGPIRNELSPLLSTNNNKSSAIESFEDLVFETPNNPTLNTAVFEADTGEQASIGLENQSTSTEPNVGFETETEIQSSQIEIPESSNTSVKSEVTKALAETDALGSPKQIISSQEPSVMESLKEAANLEVNPAPTLSYECQTHLSAMDIDDPMVGDLEPTETSVTELCENQEKPKSPSEVLDINISKSQLPLIPSIDTEEVEIVQPEAKVPSINTEEVEIVLPEAKVPSINTKEVEIVLPEAKVLSINTEGVEIVLPEAKVLSINPEEVEIVLPEAIVPSINTEEVEIVLPEAKVPSINTKEVEIVQPEAAVQSTSLELESNVTDLPSTNVDITMEDISKNSGPIGSECVTEENTTISDSKIQSRDVDCNTINLESPDQHEATGIDAALTYQKDDSIQTIEKDGNESASINMEVVHVNVEESAITFPAKSGAEDVLEILENDNDVEVIELSNETIAKTSENITLEPEKRSVLKETTQDSPIKQSVKTASNKKVSSFDSLNKTLNSAISPKVSIRAAKSCTSSQLESSIGVGGDEKRGRGRPKRNAARAAGTKIKTLILRTLEPSAVEEVSDPMTQKCAQCKRTKLCRFVIGNSGLCSENCHALYLRAQAEIGERLCQECHGPMSSPVRLSWETMDFCKEECLAQYQVGLGMNCINCSQAVKKICMGKYCVRLGNKIKQFCASTCLEEYEKGLKSCSYCQKDISTGAEGFLAPVGNKGQFKEFCTKECMTKYTGSASTEPNINPCAVCGDMKPVTIEVLQGSNLHTLCSEPCFAAFKFVNSVSEGPCHQCKKYFDKVNLDRVNIYVEERLVTLCCKTCLNVYVLANREIKRCSWCKVVKFNFDMIKKTGPEGTTMMCSLACLKSFEETSGSRRNICDQCGIYSVAEYKTPSSAGMRHFCSYKCAITHKGSKLPTNKSPTQRNEGATESVEKACQTAATAPQIYQHIVTKPPEHVEVRNKSILCKPYMHNKGTSCRPMPCPKSTQTDSSLNLQTLVPIPVPIYIPAPVHMYSAPYPVPIPFPLPIPVPIFIPTTRNSAKGILKEIKKIQEKIPNDPFEAELLMMAEMVAGEKKQEVTDSESDGDGNDAHDGGDASEQPESFSPEAVDTNAFGEDMLQMALKMASELDEPAVDMESVLTSSTITPSAQPTVDSKALYGIVPTVTEETAHSMAILRGRKRMMRGGRGGSTVSKRGRRGSGASESSVLPNLTNMPPAEMAQPQRIEIEKPDAHMRLKYTFGVNAWRHWVMQKNQELEKVMLTNRKVKPFKPDLLQLTADELNFSLCLFVTEVKKPNGHEYAPDTIYYLCLGIQQYLFENGRIDNIFTDTYYEKFTDCLDDVAKKFANIYGDSQYIVTRVEEEHLWESKQLGAHSPHVLLSTLMFFNTKHFNLVTVEEHMQLSFSHIMKHWKRNPNAPGIAKVPGSRNVLLRFYPPQSALEANSRKKKVYEQQENEENPLRCPVKLYEFYLSKCPESVKTRNDVFYLLPERSCVPDSPVWYSTMALGKDPLMKMLHRVKMVKEINVALLTP